MREAMLAEQAALSEQQQLQQLQEQDDTHALAKRKEAEMAKLADAFGVKNAVRVWASCWHTPSCTAG